MKRLIVSFLLGMTCSSGFVFCFSPAETPSQSQNAKRTEIAKLKLMENVQTVFLNTFNGKEIFSLDGDYSEKQLVEYEGELYLIYFEKIEDNKVFMGAKNISKKLPKPNLPF